MTIFRQPVTLLSVVWIGLVSTGACHSKGIDSASESTADDPTPAGGAAGNPAASKPLIDSIRPIRVSGGGSPMTMTGGAGAGGSAGGGASVSMGGATPAQAGGGGVLGSGGVPNLSQFCGDGIRDPLTEECDDGPGLAPDLCSPDCHAQALVLTDPMSTGSQRLGGGRHVASAGSEGFGVVYTIGTSPLVFLSRFWPTGEKLGMSLEVSAGARPLTDADPVVAALPRGRYAVAWIDRLWGTPDIALRLVEADGQLGPVIDVNTTRVGVQIDPDILWTGSDLLVGWTDEQDVKLRRFDENGAPRADEEGLSTSSALESSASFAAFGTGHAEAWRSVSQGRESIFVHANGALWSTAPEYIGPAHDRPTLLELDATHLLVVHAIGTDPQNIGVPAVPRLRGAILDLAQQGPVQSFDVAPMVPPYDQDITLIQQRPALARAGTKIFLSWQSESPLGDPNRLEVWLQELSWSSAAPNTLVRHPELPLGITAPRAGDQLYPALAGSPLLPDGALITAFQDNGSGSRGTNPLLVVSLRPMPLVLLNPVPAQ